MDMDVWTSEIKKALIEISDEEFQKKYWVHGDEHIVTSFEETINRLFDDLNFDHFINEYQKKSNPDPSFYSELKKFRDAMNLYLDKLPGTVDPSTVIGNPEWQQLGRQAKGIIDQL